MLDHESICCRLCINICCQPHSLYDEAGQANEIHRLMSKYFTNTMLNMEWEQRLTYICEECWRHIYEFHNFQEAIIKAQIVQVQVKVEMEKEEESRELSQLSVNVKPQVEIKQIENQLQQYLEKPIQNNCKDFGFVKQTPQFSEKRELSNSYDSSSMISHPIKLEPPLDLDHDYVEYEQEACSDMEVTANVYDDAAMPTVSRPAISYQENEEENSNFSLDDEQPLSSRTRKKPSKFKHRTLGQFDQLIAQWRTNLDCVICLQVLPSYSLLLQHFNVLHPEQDCHLLCCQLKLTTLYEIERHIRYHQAPPHLRCDACCMAFIQEKLFKAHVLKVHEGCKTKKKQASDSVTVKKKYECNECERSYESQLKLKLHARVHVPKKFKCTLCTKSFGRHSEFLEHMERHKGDKKYVCSYCSEAFTCKRYLLRHIKNYRHEPKAKVPVPEAGIKNVLNKKTEAEVGCLDKKPIAVPTTETEDSIKFESDILTQNYETLNLDITKEQSASNSTAEDDLSLQLGKPNEEALTQQDSDALIAQWKPNLECPLCQEILSSFSLLNKHFQLQHPFEKSHILCCQRPLYRPKDIEYHIEYHKAPKDLKCDLCCTYYRNRLRIYQHNYYQHTTTDKGSPQPKATEDRPHECPHCQKTYKSKSNLKKHCQLLHNKETLKHACPICHKAYLYESQLRYHMVIHSRENEHICDFCSESFPYYYGLLAHLQRAHYSQWKEMQHRQEKMPISKNKVLLREKKQVQKEKELLGELSCTLCLMEFATLRDLSEHVATVHSQEQLVKGLTKEEKGLTKEEKEG